MGGCVSSAQTSNVAISGGSTEETPGRIDSGRRRLSLSKSPQAAVSNTSDLPRGHVAKGTLNAHVLSFFPSASRKMSISGQPCKNLQRGFENKAVDETEGATWATDGIGFACKKGLKPESPNQDDFCILKVDDWAMYGVFDGHGPFGHDVSNYVQTHLPKLIASDPQLLTDPVTCMRNNFIQIHKLLEKGKINCQLSGCTSTVVIHREQQLIVAHVGDSRAVLVSRDPGRGRSRVLATDLTEDHKPNLEREMKRINAAGGQVRRLEGDIPHRVFLKGKHYPGLAMSRALGDLLGGQAGVIADPDVTVYDVEEGKDLFLILCSDGVWEFISSQEAADMVQKKISRHGVHEAAEALAQESWRRWIAEEGNVVDDITVEIAFLYPLKPGDKTEELSDKETKDLAKKSSKITI
eukprot:Platyproteum_vivax@DN6257_c0_g1_i1.p1